MYRDYRDLLAKEKPDVVTIGTPDHWHVPIAIAALQAGCHVYCEKPLTLTIDEGLAIRKAVHDSGKIFQVGTQQRSEYNRQFLKAIALVQSGRLGKHVNAYAAIGQSEVGGPYATVAPPSDLDWNLWVGPAPQAEYSPQRKKEFRWYFDYSGGNLTDWGATTSTSPVGPRPRQIGACEVSGGKYTSIARQIRLARVLKARRNS
jgi:predicted dehydrogenase